MNNSLNNKQIIFILATLLFLLFNNIVFSQDNREQITFYSDKSSAPYEFKGPKDKVMGFNIEILEAVSKKIDLDIKVIAISYDELKEKTVSDEQFGLTGIMLNDRNTDYFNVSEAFIEINIGIFIKKTSDIKTIEDLRDNKVLVVAYSKLYDYLIKNNITGSITPVESQKEALILLNTANYDAALLRSLDGGYLLDRMNLSKIRIINTAIVSQKISFAITKNSGIPISLFNDGLRLIQVKGEYDKIYKKWFGISTQSKYNEKVINIIIWSALGVVFLIIITIIWIWSLRRQVNIKTKDLQNELNRRKKIEKALADEKTLLHALINSIPDLIFYKDKNLRYLGINKALSDFLSIDKNDMIGKSDEELFNPEKAKGYRERDLEALTKNVEIRLENWDRNAKGDNVLIETLKTAYLDSEGNIVGIVGISRDITHKHQNEKELKIAKEKAERADNLKSAFLANMSHEIRTPMNSIVGFSDLLGDPDLTQDQREEFIELITAGSNDLLNLIDDIIDISKIEAGQIQINDNRFQLNRVMQELFTLIKNLQKRSKKENIEIELIRGTDKDDFTIETDQFRLKQILTNLLSNALKFTKEGHIGLGYKLNNENKTIEFYVKDTGIGIPKDKFKFILMRFAQIKPENGKAVTGTGLGLAISANLVKLLGGKLQLESEINKGSTFKFTIPLIEIKYEEFENVQPKSKRLVYNWKEKTILIAEDEELNYLFLEKVLAKTSVKIIWAKNGQEAVDIGINDKLIDLILMDIKMPLLDGYEATRKIKAKRKEIPIIAQTAYAMADERSRAINSGCNGYLTKPIKPDVLLKTIGNFIS